MTPSLPFILIISTAIAAPPSLSTLSEEYPEIIMPQKRAALVLDRLLVALQNALHEDRMSQELIHTPERIHLDEPRVAPLRVYNNENMVGLQRRGQGGSRGRVLRCYFNAITCF